MYQSYNASAESVLGIAAFQVKFIEPLFIKAKDKLFPPKQKTLDNRLSGYASVYLFGLKGALPIMKEALKKGANPDYETERLDSEWRKIGTEPLIVRFARNRSLELVQLLVDAGADLNAKDSDGKTALDVSKSWSGRDTEITRYLADKGAQSGGEKTPANDGGTAFDANATASSFDANATAGGSFNNKASNAKPAETIQTPGTQRQPSGFTPKA
jgi:hypothetical protein